MHPERPAWRRILGSRYFRWIVVLVLALAAPIGLLMLFEEAFIFFPSRLYLKPFAQHRWNSLLESVHGEDAFFAAPDGTRLHGVYFPLEEATVVILVSHGNAGNVLNRFPLATLMQLNLKASVFVYDYRGYGQSNGRPSEKGVYQDGLAAYKHLTEKLKVDPNKIVLWGESLGSAVSLEVARQVPHRAVVLQSPFTSALDMGARMIPWLPVRRWMRNRFDNLEKIQHISTPILIVHGTEDRIVPFDMGEALYRAARPPKSFVPVPGADHNDLWTVADEKVWERINTFFSEYGDEAQHAKKTASHEAQ